MATYLMRKEFSYGLKGGTLMKFNIFLKSILVICLSIIVLSNPKLSANENVQKTGDLLQLILPSYAAGITIIYEDGQGALQLTKAFGVTMAITYGLKYSLNVERPYEGGGGYSFPSGHTSSSFSAAEFIRMRYGWGYGAPAYILATFVGYSRIESHQHRGYEVIAGAAIGVLSSFIFTKPYHGWHINIEGDTKSIGLNFSRSF